MTPAKRKIAKWIVLIGCCSILGLLLLFTTYDENFYVFCPVNVPCPQISSKIETPLGGIPSFSMPQEVFDIGRIVTLMLLALTDVYALRGIINRRT